MRGECVDGVKLVVGVVFTCCMLVLSVSLLSMSVARTVCGDLWLYAERERRAN